MYADRKKQVPRRTKTRTSTQPAEAMDMLLSELGEFGFIDRIASLADDDPRVVVGIGDDAAALDLGGPELVIVTTDAHLQGRHFDLAWMTPREVGWRAGAAAISDIAAMGARPVAVFCSCALPPAWPADQAEELLAGLNEVASSVDAVLAGGDTVAGEQVALDVVVIGSVPRGQELLRSGARPGQVLAVTGALGATGAALALFATSGPEALAREALAPVRERFVHPHPRIEAGRAIAASGRATAAMDISDGLAQDAGHMADRSGVAVVIEAARVPVADGCAPIADEIGGDALTWALTGGEDFELLVALDEDQVAALSEMFAVAEVGLTVVGRVEEGAGVTVIGPDGQPMELASDGWEHF
jgi:thiamine-monophosphate kinase